MSSKYFCVIPYLKCDLDFGVPVLSTLGLIYSLWASDYFWLALRIITGINPNSRYDYFMAGAMKNTHYILALISAVLLFVGFKNENKNYVRYWYNLKIIESISVGIGFILFTTRITRYWPYYIAAIIIIVSGWYVIINVKNEMKEIPEQVTNEIKTDNSELPPPYETFVNEKENLETSVDIKS